MTDLYSSISLERILLVPNNGTPMECTVMEYNLKFATSYAANAPNLDVTHLYKLCKQEVCQDSELAKTYLIPAQVGERTEPSELVLGTATFKNPAREEDYLPNRPTQTPVEASVDTTEYDGAMAIWSSFRTDCKFFSCQYPEPLPDLSKEHIILCSCE